MPKFFFSWRFITKSWCELLKLHESDWHDEWTAAWLNTTGTSTICGSVWITDLHGFMCVYCMFFSFKVAFLFSCFLLVVRISAMWVLSDSVIFISSSPFSRFSLKCHGPVFSCIHTWLAEGQHWHGGVKLKVQLALLTTCRAEGEDGITERWLYGQKKVCKITTVNSHPNKQNYWEKEDTQLCFLSLKLHPQDHNQPQETAAKLKTSSLRLIWHCLIRPGVCFHRHFHHSEVVR